MHFGNEIFKDGNKLVIGHQPRHFDEDPAMSRTNSRGLSGAAIWREVWAFVQSINVFEAQQRLPDTGILEALDES